MADYFFELLTEEIPAWMHDTACRTLQDRLTKIAADLGAADPSTSVVITTTPRRIAFMISGLRLREEDREIEVKGPPKKSAFDSEGKPTQALLGFLKKNSASMDDVIDSGDEYVRVRRNVAGRETAEILRERIPETITALRWPKMMRWGVGEFSYIRPIHSIVSVLDGEPLPISMFGIDSGVMTVGHRTLAREPIEVRTYAEYVSKLELARVVVDATRRRDVMAQRAIKLAAEVGGAPAADASIWSQWQYLTEYPGLVRAQFREDYLVLPEEVLVTVMRVHQKQLPIRSADGRLTSSFLAVMDNEGDPDGNAAYGNSFVTNARFADAKFFYETDRRTKLEDRVESLTRLQFQEKLGNYAEKSARIEKVAAAISAELKLDAADTLVAARLCKTDLVTEMVKEFTELQGKIGGIYAREEGLPDGVWQAIYDHYLPVNLDDELPRTTSGAIVAIADKIDTLFGFFSVGIRPTGSKDPFALRRAAQGIVQILLLRDRRQLAIGLDRLIDLAADAYGTADSAAVKKDLLEFFSERVRTLLEATNAYDEVAAAMESGWASSLTDVAERAAALRDIRNDPNFLSILDSAKRIANITAGQTPVEIDASRLELDVEKRLAGLAVVVGDQISEMIAGKRYRSALESFAAMAPELETFFKDVMVMVDDEALRRNRMSLLRKVGDSVQRIADVTKIVVDRRDYRP
jgi:glycyl-tRNA synthetase beta chain